MLPASAQYIRSRSRSVSPSHRLVHCHRRQPNLPQLQNTVGGPPANKDNPRTVGFCGGPIGVTYLFQPISSSKKTCCQK
uniref:Uncharacterized protein n=1 Tax=Hyaloperonospora arabidopsidis (strain Emoy2) TaxID=559515 RepID=M4BAJ6_HYAAE